MKLIKIQLVRALTWIALLLAVPHAYAGGRVGVGGGDDYFKNLPPQVLKKRFLHWNGNMGSPPPSPQISKVDPYTKETPLLKGCGIPTGEIEYLDDVETVNPPPASKSPGLDESGASKYEHRMAPSDGCKSIELWTFYRSLANQRRFHLPPKACVPYRRAGKSAYSASMCQKVPYYRSAEAAKSAHAKAPFAYLDHDKVVVDYGQFFYDWQKDVFRQNTEDGKVIGTRQSIFDVRSYEKAMEMRLTAPKGPYDCAISDKQKKATSTDPFGLACKLPAVSGARATDSSAK